MSVVVDASVAAAFVLPDEQTSSALAVRARIVASGALAPAIFWYEIRNVILLSERRGRVPEGYGDQLVSRIAALPIELQPVDDDDVVRIARTRRLTVYDAAYLSVAKRHAVPLATFDSALANAAAREGVDVIK